MMKLVFKLIILVTKGKKKWYFDVRVVRHLFAIPLAPSFNWSMEGILCRCCQLDWQFHLIPKDWANNMTSQNHDVTKGDTKKKLFCSFIFLMKFWSRRESSTTNSELASCCYFLNVQSILIGLNRIIIRESYFGVISPPKNRNMLLAWWSWW